MAWQQSRWCAPTYSYGARPNGYYNYNNSYVNPWYNHPYLTWPPYVKMPQASAEAEALAPKAEPGGEEMCLDSDSSYSSSESGSDTEDDQPAPVEVVLADKTSDTATDKSSELSGSVLSHEASDRSTSAEKDRESSQMPSVQRDDCLLHITVRKILAHAERRSRSRSWARRPRGR